MSMGNDQSNAAPVAETEDLNALVTTMLKVRLFFNFYARIKSGESKVFKRTKIVYDLKDICDI